MLKTMGVVQVDGDLQTCGKLRRRLGGVPLLTWVVRRMTDCLQLNGVIVVARSSADERSVAELVPSDVPVFVGAESDALGRFLRALEKYPAESVVRVRGDNPFVDPGLIDRLVTTAAAHPECDYISYCARDGRPTILSPVGICAEWFRARSLRKAAKRRLTLADRENLTQCFFANPETFAIRLIPAPVALDRDDVRLTVDIEEDWDHALAIFEALGHEHWDWQRIAALLDQHPALRMRMAALNRACAEG
jgi:spore coat polysaccharide biosynthesis protein SpsF